MKKKWMPMLIWITAAAVVVIAVIYALNNLWGDKPVKTVTAREVAESEIKIPRGNSKPTETLSEDVYALAIYVDTTGVVNLGLFPEEISATADSMRIAVIEGAVRRYAELTGANAKLSATEAKTLMKQPLVDYSLAAPGVPNPGGVPTAKIKDDSLSQFQIWVDALSDVKNEQVQQSIRNGSGIVLFADKNTPYAEVSVVMDQLKELGRSKFAIKSY
ncbi:MAG: hypothetical protein K2L93_01895 [Muribaculaceae bacterium]|nr:hypothetical protein [Muribaculaceae bacterium]